MEREPLVKTNRDRLLFRPLNIENVQDRTIGRRLPRASRHRPGQQLLELFQVGKLGANVFEMMRGDLAYFAA